MDTIIGFWWEEWGRSKLYCRSQPTPSCTWLYKRLKYRLSANLWWVALVRHNRMCLEACSIELFEKTTQGPWYAKAKKQMKAWISASIHSAAPILVSCNNYKLFIDKHSSLFGKYNYIDSIGMELRRASIGFCRKVDSVSFPQSTDALLRNCSRSVVFFKATSRWKASRIPSQYFS